MGPDTKLLLKMILTLSFVFLTPVFILLFIGELPKDSIKQANEILANEFSSACAPARGKIINFSKKQCVCSPLPCNSSVSQ